MRLRGLDALRSRNYVLYLVGHFTSQTGAWVEQTAVSWILYELTGSALLLGLAGLARAAPTIALALVGGAVAALIQAELEFWHTAQPEVFGGYLTLAALLVATGEPHPRRRFWTWVATGLLFGLAFLFKPPLGGGAFVCGAYLAKREQQRTDSTPRALFTMSIVGASAALPILLCGAWFWLRGAWPALHWTLGEFTPGYTARQGEGRCAVRPRCGRGL